jgi:protein SCO1/2
MVRFSFVVLLFCSLLFSESNETKKKIGVYEKLGDKIDLGLTFTNEKGKTFTLKEMIGDKPTFLTLNYYNCPGICSPQVASLADTLNTMELLPSKDYNVITLSIEKNDTPKLAQKKKNAFLSNLSNYPLFDKGWYFLVGNQQNIDAITKAVGIEYERRIGKDGVVDYLHPGVVIAISPKGKITRYINGIKYPKFDLKMSLIEASNGKVNATRVAALAFCFAYDVDSKKYVFQWEKIVGGFMFLSVVLFFVYMVISTMIRRRKQ